MSRDLRRYARQTTTRLVIGGLLILLVVGDGLIYWLYGPQSAVLGLICILAGLAPVALIWLALAIMEWIVKRANQD